MPILRIAPQLAQRCLRFRYFSSMLPLRGESPKDLKETDKQPLSSCPAGTILQGLTYLKDQPPVKALPDEDYPAWLWTVLKAKEWPDDGPGGKAEKAKLRKENKAKIKYQNFMKTQ